MWIVSKSSSYCALWSRNYCDVLYSLSRLKGHVFSREYWARSGELRYGALGREFWVSLDLHKIGGHITWGKQELWIQFKLSTGVAEKPCGWHSGGGRYTKKKWVKEWRPAQDWLSLSWDPRCAEKETNLCLHLAHQMYYKSSASQFMCGWIRVHSQWHCNESGRDQKDWVRCSNSQDQRRRFFAYLKGLWWRMNWVQWRSKQKLLSFS